MALEDAMQFDPAAYEKARARVTSDPLSLEPADFQQLAIVSAHLEDEARDAQRQAQLALVTARAAAAPIVSKSAEAAPRKKDIDSWDEFVERYGSKKVSVTMLGMMVKTFEDVLAAANAKNQERNARLDALEQRGKEQDARILELEAVAAAAQAVPQ